MTKKTLMTVDSRSMTNLHAGASAGMNFHVVETPSGPMIVLQSGEAMPLFDHDEYFCLSDCLINSAVPQTKAASKKLSMMKNHSGRRAAMHALNRANISPLFMGGVGASPLIGTSVLERDTVFYRFVSSPVDHRYNNEMLSAETYVTTSNDAKHVNSGFAVVARYALPLPLPANYRIEYTIPKGTKIQVGTVAPNFGQAGGGVEVFLPEVSAAFQSSVSNLPDF